MTLRRRDILRIGAALPVAAVAGGGAAAAATRPSGVRPCTITTSAGTFDAVAAGPPGGRKVLLLHGYPEFGIEWSAQLAALGAAGYRAVAPDQRGYSDGVRPDGIAPYHLDEPVRDVLRMAVSLGWRRFDVVGHDWGACVAWLAAARYPGLVRSLTAVSVPHPAAFAESLRTDPVQQRAARYMAKFRRPTPIPENEMLAGGPPKLAGVDPRKDRYYYDRLREPGALTAALNWYRANDFTGFARDVVTVPTLFVSGSADPTVAASGVAATRRWVCGRYRHVPLAGVGHFIPESVPDTMSRLLLDHLRSVT